MDQPSRRDRGGRRPGRATAVIAVTCCTLSMGSSAWAGEGMPSPGPIASGRLPSAAAAPVGASSPYYESGLYDDVSISTGNAWAVGDYSPDRVKIATLTLHWNGRAWKMVPSPNPAGAGVAVLGRMDALSGRDIWAVGYSQTDSSASSLIEHWNGRAWALVPSPNPPGAVTVQLSGVSAVSPTDAWAVGTSSDGTVFTTLIEHWNGNRWKQVPSPNPPGSNAELNSVDVVSATDIWAVGDAATGSMDSTLVEHWDGTAWSVVATPNPAGATYAVINTVHVVSPTDVWAVGDSESGSTYSTLVEHWNGHKWKLVSNPNPAGGGYLTGLSVASGDDVWSVGGAFDGDSTKTLAEHWNGHTWKQVPIADPEGATYASLSGASSSSTNDAWAVGQTLNGSLSDVLIEHWNGHKWSITAIE